MIIDQQQPTETLARNSMPCTFDMTILIATDDCYICDGPIPPDELDLLVIEGVVQHVHRICNQSVVD